MKEFKPLLPLDLQYFADGGQEPEPNEPAEPTEPTKPTEPSNEPKEPPKKIYTEEELQAIIKDRVAREKKAAEKAIKEAEKLAKMNEEQKKEYEFEKLKAELDEYKRKDAFNTMSKEASKMLADKGINADDELLAFVVRETAEDTQKAVNSFVAMFNKHVEEGVKKALAGKAPRANTNNKTLTKAEIMAEKDPIKRQKLIAANPHLFSQFKK